MPVRIQHRSGVLWTLNSAGLAQIGLADHPTADCVVRTVAGRMRCCAMRLSYRDQQETECIRGHGRHRRDTGYGRSRRREADGGHRRGELHQRVHCLAPGKRILHDTDLDLADLAEWIVQRHADGGPVAVHCVTAAQLVVTLSALRSAGAHPRDRIEHAAVVPDGSVAELVGVGVTVVTQPNFVAERGEQYLDDVPAAEHHELWRVASLLRAAVPVALSTDMPFGDDDPWKAMRAAVHRTTGRGSVLGAEECVSPRDALTMFFGEADAPVAQRRIAPGQPGDLCILTAAPAEVLSELDSSMVMRRSSPGMWSTAANLDV